MSKKPAADTGPERERTDLEGVLQRFYALSYRQQVRLHRIAREYLGGELDEGNEFEKQLREREEALDVIERVAKHIGLPEGQALKGREFTAAVRELGITGWTVTRVGDAFGRWTYATAAYNGGWFPETSVQFSQRRATSGRKRTHETYLFGVRRWLDDAVPATTTTAVYNRFCDEENPGRIARGELPFTSASAVLQKVGLLWADVVSVARDDIDFDEASAQRLQERTKCNAGPLKLVGIQTVSLLTGMASNMVAYNVNQGTFPKPVAAVGSSNAWHLTDVQAYVNDARWPTRPDYAWQHKVLDTNGVAEHFGYIADSVRTVLQAKGPTLPPPAGRVGRVHYWLRKDVEAFERPAPKLRNRSR